MKRGLSRPVKSRMSGPFSSLNKSRWHPALGNPGETEELLAVSVLAALSIAGIHSAINPSVFTLLTFGSKPEAKARAMTGLWIGLVASTLASGAIWVVFKKALPAIISEATAAALFGVGVWAVEQEPTKTVPAIEQQQETQGA